MPVPLSAKAEKVLAAAGVLSDIHQQNDALRIPVIETTFAGQKVPTGGLTCKAEGAPMPTLTVDTPLDTSKTYILLELDLDPPHPSFAFGGPILHWAQPGITYSATSSELTYSVDPLAPYRGPSPPGFSPPHRYVFLLYEQPDAFSLEKAGGKDKYVGLWPRLRFDLGSFEQAVGLGEIMAMGWHVAQTKI